MSLDKGLPTNDSQNKFDNNEQIETREAGRPARGGALSKVKRHCARFWWVHLIIFCIIFLIIALCLVYVAMPKIAQHDVNAANIEVTEFKFENPTMETILLTQRAKLNNPSLYTPTLDSFAAASYLVTNGTFGPASIIHVQMPEAHATKPYSKQEVVNQEVKIDDLDQLAAFATAVVSDEYVHTALVGKTKLHLGALPVVEVTFNDTSTYKGLNGLKGLNVTEVRINITAPAGIPNMVGNAFIPNPSVMTIEMGNVTLSLSTAEKGLVGTASISDFVIVPGDNVLPMTGTLNQSLILASMDPTTGIANLQIKGTSVINNGVHLTYYEAALGANSLPLAMNVTQVVRDSLGI
ncbi:hypothetical protein BJ875DRAFT_43475 [Amylocarpus encephaloides]|uniref:Uncharacterized protein n=1 Tax=Amylocarpus encephaloides TaxID=45428 RepID=A0A9P8C4S9_9HELO|nr:hypothetical protein BJ875DRAFT_43475 [Amylocarpus encephaloides]